MENLQKQKDELLAKRNEVVQKMQGVEKQYQETLKPKEKKNETP